MAKIRKIARWLPALAIGAVSSLIIVWLYWTEPKLLGAGIDGGTVAAGYTVALLFWWGIAPAASACMAGGPFFLCCAALLPAELLFALVTFRKVWPVGAALAALWLVGLLWFRRRCILKFQQKNRRRQYDEFEMECVRERIREICRRFGALMAVILLAAPAAWGVWSSWSNMPLALAAPTSAGSAERDYPTDFLSGFTEDAWKTANLAEKTALMQQLASYELAMLGVPADGMKLSVEELGEDELGYYSHSSRQIVIGRDELENGSVWECIDTIAHEAFHAQQAYVVERIDWDDESAGAAYYDLARQWLQNYQDGYVDADDDAFGYYFQPVEVDARKYAEMEQKHLRTLIEPDEQQES